MVENPKRVKVNDKYFNINYDFKNIINVIEIMTDDNISDYERAIAVIYKMYGDEGINAKDCWERLLELSKKFIFLNKEIDNDKESDMDFIQDYQYIKASFIGDYNMNIDEMQIHWWDFIFLINGLSNSEFGNCCILNRIRNIRNMNLNDIKDSKMREDFRKAKEQYALVRNVKEYKHTLEEEQSINNFMKNFE